VIFGRLAAREQVANIGFMEHGSAIRIIVFLTLFVLFALAETLAPRRVRVEPRGHRWITNWSITLSNTVLLRLMSVGLPALAVGASVDAAHLGVGLFNLITWPIWIEVVLAILFLDFAIWAQHLITHQVPFLWRLHRVHHADRDIDVTTAIRFHPVEIAFSMLLKIGLVYVLGPAAIAVILFEIILNGTALFNHANIKLPKAVDSTLRQVLVTPDMHRIHHSAKREEHDSNYGFALSIWDRMMGTYIADPEPDHDQMTIGLQWQDDRPSRLWWSLTLPFVNR